MSEIPLDCITWTFNETGKAMMKWSYGVDVEVDRVYSSNEYLAMLDNVDASGSLETVTITYPYDSGVHEIAISASGNSGFDLYQGPQQDLDFDVFHQSLDAVLEECERKKDEESRLPEELVEPGGWEKNAKQRRDEIMRRMFE